MHPTGGWYDSWQHLMQGGYVGSSTTDVQYGAGLSLVALRSELGDWFGDFTAVSAAVAALGAPLATPLASRADAAPYAASVAHAGRVRHVMPHCGRAGVVCNSMGRVVHFDAAMAAAPLPQSAAVNGSAAIEAAAEMRGILAMPWLVSVNFGEAGVAGQVPAAVALGSDAVMVRPACAF